MKEFWLDMGYYFSQIWVGWNVKAPLAIMTGFYSGYLNGDWLMFIVFCLMTLFDVLLGSWLALKRRCFDPRLFGKWVLKVLVHFAVILVVAVCIKSILAPLGVKFPLLDLFLGFLICTEGLSVLKNMRRLGWPVPKAAVRIVAGLQSEADRKAAAFFKRPENDRRGKAKPDSDASGKAYEE